MQLGRVNIFADTNGVARGGVGKRGTTSNGVDLRVGGVEVGEEGAESVGSEITGKGTKIRGVEVVELEEGDPPVVDEGCESRVEIREDSGLAEIEKIFGS